MAKSSSSSSSSSKKKTARTSTRAKRATGASTRSLARSRNRSRESFAVTCEGSVYVNIDALAALGAASLKGRKLFIGAELGRGERRLARELLDNAGHELGAKIAGPLVSVSARVSRRAPKTKPA
jgi:hypothetical protein